MDVKDIAPFVPIIVEATKFLFNEASQWLADVRKKAHPERKESASAKPATPATASNVEPATELPPLDIQQFSVLEGNAKALQATLNRAAAETNAYAIKGLVEQIQTHRKNLTDLEVVEAEYGALTPQHIKRGIEREATAIIEKTQQLQDLLSLVYQRRVQYE